MSTEIQEAFSNYILFYQNHLAVSGNTDKDSMVRCGDQTTVPRDSPANTTCVFYTQENSSVCHLFPFKIKIKK